MLSENYDLTTPDGVIHKIRLIDQERAKVEVVIKNISNKFVGFNLPSQLIFFNLKSTLAQLGIEAICSKYELDQKKLTATIEVELTAYSKLAKAFLPLMKEGLLIGKLFAAPLERRVREPEYLTRMFGRCDEKGRPLLFFGQSKEKSDLILRKIEGRTVAFLPLKQGIISFNDSIYGLLPTLALSLKHKNFPNRQLLHLHQTWQMNKPRMLEKNQILLVKTEPLHIRTVFAKVVKELLPPGFFHTSASVLQPDTTASGDIYEFYGNSTYEIHEIPLEFYTLEPYKEYVFFTDRDQLQSCIEDPKTLFKAFATAPKPDNLLASTFVVKSEQLLNLTPEKWISKDPQKHDFPGIDHPARQALLVEKYIEEQAAYPFLHAIENGIITSQGVLLCRHLPSPLLKQELLSTSIRRCLKGIYFQHPSRSFNDFFSHEDRAFLFDLSKFGIPVFWVDSTTKRILQYVHKQGSDSGMFVPIEMTETFRKATFFGVYGSNLMEGSFENELKELLEGILKLKNEVTHPLLNKDTPLALLTGGGPGVMEVGNRVAKKLSILSCGNILDFRSDKKSVVNEQRQNPHIDAKMTYRLDKLVERQAEFNLDFPIFLPGGIGTDFELSLEEVRRKTGSGIITPVILFGDEEYWKKKITPRYQCNIDTGTIRGSEWISNCFYCIQTASQGLKIYRSFFENSLKIGKEGLIYKNGFATLS